MADCVVSTFYLFADLADYRMLRGPLLGCCLEEGLKGTILLAEEGINGTVAGTRQGMDRLYAHLRTDARLAHLAPRESPAPAMPFKRMKVRLRNTLIAIGAPDVDPRRQVGTYVDPEQWNALISDPEVRVIDTRNDFEVEIGTFEGAEDPGTASFSQFPNYVRQRLDPARDRKVAMFCTGGIRCEKATAYLLQQGFEEVYHLKGGILHYLERIPAEESLWRGDCFVFDERVSVVHGLAPGDYDWCKGCGRPVDEDGRRSPAFEEGVSCPACHHALTEDQRAAFRERQRQYERRAG